MYVYGLNNKKDIMSIFETSRFYEYHPEFFTESSKYENEYENHNFYAFIDDLRSLGHNIGLRIVLADTRYGCFPFPLLETYTDECVSLLQNQADNLFSKKPLVLNTKIRNKFVCFQESVLVDVAVQAKYWCVKPQN
ncbi:hypothetical protein JIP1600_2320014 [Flavobacterium psychrophilum]|nr:hypothetical protein JIP1600_2320014 [Flavobacterium psychrophilum]